MVYVYLYIYVYKYISVYLYKYINVILHKNSGEAKTKIRRIAAIFIRNGYTDLNE